MRDATSESNDRFGATRMRADQVPTAMKRNGAPNATLLSCSDPQPLMQKPEKRAGLAQFNPGYAQWPALQNHQVEELGLWNDALRLW